MKKYTQEEVELILDRVCTLQVRDTNPKLAELLKKVGFKTNYNKALYWPSPFHRKTNSPES